ncbi:MAG: hypothetical protein E6R08_00945 [Nevskiaceae bacterium]|nr:MAG: hypothetical protein E6R08_00945 [Nevskiaceae bacterium]
MRKARAPDLTPATIELVLDLLDGWDEKLTWDLLIARVKKETGHEYSRFTFAEYPRIADAFAMKKRYVAGRPQLGPGTPKDDKVRAALAQAERYRQKAERLQGENDALIEQFVTWLTNAERYGVTLEKLNAPLPLPNRERSKVSR